ncbi:MAG TPA: HutD family protein [Pseudomonas sp.]|nr:HutD family protein [Pseudomonas sp.]
MSRASLLRAATYACMPWKNGGGSTREITRDAGEGLAGFGWRLSIADIDESGDFSRFTGYQRIITVLEGAGMALRVDGQPSRPLLAFDPFAFAGDSQVACTLLDGPIRDFNLIYAPQRYRARLQWFDLRQPVRLFSSASTLLLFSAAEQLSVRLDDQAATLLQRHDCLQLEGNTRLLEVELLATPPGRCCLIELDPQPQG